MFAGACESEVHFNGIPVEIDVRATEDAVSKIECVPKLIGGDVELGNFIIGEDEVLGMSDYTASRLLLDEIEGLPRRTLGNSHYGSYGLASAYRRSEFAGGIYDGRYSQDSGRKYLGSNGGCCYIDLNHLELATPEVLSARDYQAVWMAMLRIARNAQRLANEALAPDRRIVVLANNSDRQGHSYGGHQSFLMSRSGWDDMMRQRMLPNLFYLMAYQVSSIVFTGQGKVGSENGGVGVPFQISQRADFIETLLSIDTTVHRPLVNTRDEPLCGPESRTPVGSVPGDNYARLHVIFYDTSLAPVATYLKVGVMQLILAMIEAGQVDHSLVLDQPLDALHEWSRDPDLKVRMPLLSGQHLTAVELQLKFLEQARNFDARHGFDGLVVDAGAIIDLWEDTLLKLHAEQLHDLCGRIDWIMKRAVLTQALTEHPEWDWNSAELTYLDQIYASIDPADGLFLSMSESGCFEPVATEAEIARFVTNPPENTRAWTRAMLLRAAGPDRVANVDWDKIDFKIGSGLPRRRQILLADPLGATRLQSEPQISEDTDLSDLLDGLVNSGVVSDPQTSRSIGAAPSLLTDD